MKSGQVWAAEVTEVGLNLVGCRQSAGHSRRFWKIEIEQSSETLPPANACLRASQWRRALEPGARPPPLRSDSPDLSLCLARATPQPIPPWPSLGVTA